MKCIRRIRQLSCLAAALVMIAGCSLAETEIRVEDRGLDLSDEISIHYPAVTGLADAPANGRRGFHFKVYVLCSRLDCTLQNLRCTGFFK